MPTVLSLVIWSRRKNKRIKGDIMKYKVFQDIQNVVHKRKIKALYNHVINRKSEGRLEQYAEYQNLVKLF